jgi:hypothetical protein
MAFVNDTTDSFATNTLAEWASLSLNSASVSTWVSTDNFTDVDTETWATLPLQDSSTAADWVSTTLDQWSTLDTEEWAVLPLPLETITPQGTIVIPAGAVATDLPRFWVSCSLQLQHQLDDTLFVYNSKGEKLCSEIREANSDGLTRLVFKTPLKAAEDNVFYLSLS